MKVMSNLIDLFQQHKNSLIADPTNHWLEEKRQQAINQFLKLEFPTVENENWRYTSLRALEEKNWQFSNEHYHFTSFLQIPPSPPFSKEGKIIVTDFASALKNHSVYVKKYYTLFFDTFFNHPNQDSFYSLNAALFNQGFVIIIPENVCVEKPIEMLYSAIPEEHIACWRNLIILEKGAQATVIETFDNATLDCYFNQVVTEVYVDAHAQLSHYKQHHESPNSFHLSTLYVKQQAHSQIKSHVISCDGGFIRSDTHIRLEEEYAHCELNGFSLGRNNQYIDHHTIVEHLKPHGSSDEYYKSILNNHAKGVFNGKVIVSPGALQTDAAQSNKTLLLSRAAQMNSKPQLEIFSDDVKCSHGATIGQLDEEALFYLQTRGVSTSEARQLLVQAFLNDVLERMSLTDFLKEDVQKHIELYLSSLLILS